MTTPSGRCSFGTFQGHRLHIVVPPDLPRSLRGFFLLAMRKPPRKVQIVGKTYTLSANPRLIPDDEQTGNCVAAQGKIEYDPAQSADNLRDTILHEVLHGVWSEMGLGEHFDAKQEEVAVRGLATGLLDALRRNPQLAKFLLERT